MRQEALVLLKVNLLMFMIAVKTMEDCTPKPQKIISYLLI